VETTPLPPVDTPVFKENWAFTNKILGLPRSFAWDEEKKKVIKKNQTKASLNLYTTPQHPLQIVFPMLVRLYQLFIKTEFKNTTLQPYDMQTTPGSYHPLK